MAELFKDWYWYIVRIHRSGVVEPPLEFDSQDDAEYYFDTILLHQINGYEPYMTAATTSDQARLKAAEMYRTDLRKEAMGIRSFQYLKFTTPVAVAVKPGGMLELLPEEYHTGKRIKKTARDIVSEAMAKVRKPYD